VDRDKLREQIANDPDLPCEVGHEPERDVLERLRITRKVLIAANFRDSADDVAAAMAEIKKLQHTEVEPVAYLREWQHAGSSYGLHREVFDVGRASAMFDEVEYWKKNPQMTCTVYPLYAHPPKGDKNE